ncbi:hypothetical protein B0H13DRAFT_2650641 [Mycena leptocephala]|nr:hypothetical protein B0H13DRAFT_2650641 [Mycena leptocephala]
MKCTDGAWASIPSSMYIMAPVQVKCPSCTNISAIFFQCLAVRKNTTISRPESPEGIHSLPNLYSYDFMVLLQTPRQTRNRVYNVLLDNVVYIQGRETARKPHPWNSVRSVTLIPSHRPTTATPPFSHGPTMTTHPSSRSPPSTALTRAHIALALLPRVDFSGDGDEGKARRWRWECSWGGEEHLDAYWGILMSTAEMELEIEKEMEKVAHIDADRDGAGLEQEEKARSSRHPERLRSAGEGAGAALARVYPALVPTSLLLPRLRLRPASAGPLPLLEHRSRLAHCRLLFLGCSAWHEEGCMRLTILPLYAPALVLVPCFSQRTRRHPCTPSNVNTADLDTHTPAVILCTLRCTTIHRPHGLPPILDQGPASSACCTAGSGGAGMVTPWEMLRIEGEQRRRRRQSACGMHAGMTVFGTAVPLGGGGS